MSTAEIQTSISRIVQDSWVAPEDVVMALKEMALVETNEGSTGEVVLARGKVRAWADQHSVLMIPPADTTAFTEASAINSADEAIR